MSALDSMLDAMEDKTLVENLTAIIEICERRALEGEKTRAWSQGEDSGRYMPEDYRICLGLLAKLQDALDDAMVYLDDDDRIDLDAFDEKVIALRGRIAAKVAARAAVAAAKKKEEKPGHEPGCSGIATGRNGCDGCRCGSLQGFPDPTGLYRSRR
jgi:hypothetical protein